MAQFYWDFQLIIRLLFIPQLYLGISRHDGEIDCLHLGNISVRYPVCFPNILVLEASPYGLRHSESSFVSKIDFPVKQTAVVLSFLWAVGTGGQKLKPISPSLNVSIVQAAYIALARLVLVHLAISQVKSYL